MAFPTFASKDGNLVNQAFGVQIDSFNAYRNQVSLDHQASTYCAAASFTPTATGAVTVITMVGNATKTVRIKSILLSGHSSANAETFISLQRTTALGAGGTAVNPTVAKLDGNSPGSALPTAVAHYTSTLKAAGTAAGGPLYVAEFYTGVVTTPTVTTPVFQLFPFPGVVGGQSLVLRGVGDFIEVQNLNAGNLSAVTILEYTICWEEDNS